MSQRRVFGKALILSDLGKHTRASELGEVLPLTCLSCRRCDPNTLDCKAEVGEHRYSMLDREYGLSQPKKLSRPNINGTIVGAHTPLKSICGNYYHKRPIRIDELIRPLEGCQTVFFY